MPNTKDPRALSSRTSMGEPAEERPARDRERCAGSMENRSPLPAFFRPRTGRPVFRGSSRGFQFSNAVRRRRFGYRQDGVKASHAASREEARRQITEPEEAREPNPWLRRVGWVEHLGAFDREELRALVAPVKDDEPELDVLCRAFDWLIQDA